MTDMKPLLEAVINLKRFETTNAPTKPTQAQFRAKIARIHGSIDARMRKGVRGSINDAAASSTRNRGVTVTLPKLKFLEGGKP